MSYRSTLYQVVFQVLHYANPNELVAYALVWSFSHASHQCGRDSASSFTIYTVHTLKKLMFYGRTTLMATGVRRLRLQAYHAHGYDRTWSKATGVLRLQLWVYRSYNYGRATGVL